MGSKVTAAVVMAVLWPALKLLEGWAWWVDRNEKRGAHR